MTEEYDTHTETESEDGGVALVKYRSSDEMEIDDDSSATSAPSSSSEPSEDFAETGETTGASVVDGANAQSGGILVALDVGSDTPDMITASPPQGSTYTPSHTIDHISFAEALSGELSTLPEHNEFHSEEEPSDPNHPQDPPFGTPHVFPTPLVVAPNTFVSDGGEASVPTTTVASSFEPHVVLPHHVSFQGDNPHHTSLPLFTAAFGADFLPQSAFPADDTSPTFVDEHSADYWDDIEDNPKNFYCYQFFDYWKRMYANDAPDYPRISDLAIEPFKVQRPKKVLFDEIGKEHEDVQGIHWSRFRTTREKGREVRRMTYRNHRNVGHMKIGFGTPGYKACFQGDAVPFSGTFFDFQEMNMRYRPSYSHFQLRHNLSACSKNAVFYSYRPHDDDFFNDDESIVLTRSGAKIMCYNPEADTSECAMDPTKLIDKGASKLDSVTTLTASDGVLVAGSIEGHYAVKSLSDTFESEPTTGVITEHTNASTNHIHTFLDRCSGLPHAVISSNDRTIRTLDCTANKFTRIHTFPYPVNCSATSPDGRLRLLVGDDTYPIVSNAETGEIIAQLPDHKDHGFACAWAPDDITLATGCQDGLVQVWDARKLTQSIHILPMEMGGCRALQFSPLGSGKRVLVLAEPADFVHVVDAQSYESKQTIDFFGEIAGISMPPDGSRLYIANSDVHYGGLMEFDRSWERKGHNGLLRRRSRRSAGVSADDSWNDEDEFAGDEWAPSHRLHLDRHQAWNRHREKRKGYNLGTAQSYDWLSDDDEEMGWY